MLKISIIVLYPPKFLFCQSVTNFVQYKTFEKFSLVRYVSAHSLEQVHVELLKSSSSQGLSKVLSFDQGFDLNPGLMLGGQSSLCFLYLVVLFMF